MGANYPTINKKKKKMKFYLYSAFPKVQGRFTLYNTLNTHIYITAT